MIASHVLEHMAVAYWIARLPSWHASRGARLIYLLSRAPRQLRAVPGFRNIDLSIVIDLFNTSRGPTG